MTKTYTTIAGDMWDGVAYKVFGDEGYTDQIMKENPKHRHVVVFPAGVTLALPDETTEVSAELPPWKRLTL